MRNYVLFTDRFSLNYNSLAQIVAESFCAKNGVFIRPNLRPTEAQLGLFKNPFLEKTWSGKLEIASYFDKLSMTI